MLSRLQRSWPPSRDCTRADRKAWSCSGRGARRPSGRSGCFVSRSNAAPTAFFPVLHVGFAGPHRRHLFVQIKDYDLYQHRQKTRRGEPSDLSRFRPIYSRVRRNFFPFGFPGVGQQTIDNKLYFRQARGRSAEVSRCFPVRTGTMDASPTARRPMRP